RTAASVNRDTTAPRHVPDQLIAWERIAATGESKDHVFHSADSDARSFTFCFRGALEYFLKKGILFRELRLNVFFLRKKSSHNLSRGDLSVADIRKQRFDILQSQIMGEFFQRPFLEHLVE